MMITASLFYRQLDRKRLDRTAVLGEEECGASRQACDDGTVSGVAAADTIKRSAPGAGKALTRSIAQQRATSAELCLPG
jgi:hypothetical protein